MKQPPKHLLAEAARPNVSQGTFKKPGDTDPIEGDEAEQWAIFVITALCVEPWDFAGKEPWLAARQCGDLAWAAARSRNDHRATSTHSNFFHQEPLRAYHRRRFGEVLLRPNPDSRRSDDANQNTDPQRREHSQSHGVLLLRPSLPPVVSLLSNVSRKPSRERRGRGMHMRGHCSSARGCSLDHLETGVVSSGVKGKELHNRTVPRPA
jgi:hypothetical protein